MLKDNLVGAVLIVSTLLWIPASCLISWVRKTILLHFYKLLANTLDFLILMKVDRKRKRQLETEEAWLRSGDLIHPSENGTRRIVHARLRPSQQR